MGAPVQSAAHIAGRVGAGFASRVAQSLTGDLRIGSSPATLDDPPATTLPGVEWPKYSAAVAAPNRERTMSADERARHGRPRINPNGQ
jgi:hypothetical protein